MVRVAVDGGGGLPRGLLRGGVVGVVVGRGEVRVDSVAGVFRRGKLEIVDVTPGGEVRGVGAVRGGGAGVLRVDVPVRVGAVRLEAVSGFVGVVADERGVHVVVAGL